MLNVAIYFRYSTSLTAQKQNSEKRQRGELLEKALSNGWNIVWHNGDKETSGYKTKPKLEELKELVYSKQIRMDILLVSSFDRLTRKDSLEFQDDVAWIRKAGAKLSILDSGDELIDLNDNQKLLLLQMKVYAANQYLKDLANKTISGQVARFKRGDLGFSNVPFGFERDGRTIKPSDDIEIVKRIFSRFVETETIAACIEILLESDKYKGKQTGVNPSTIKRILRHPLYIGKRVWGAEGCGDHQQAKGYKTGAGKFINRLVEATETIDVSHTIGNFVDPELWYKANEILDRNSELFKNRSRAKDKRSTYKYSAMLRCECGRKMVGAKTAKGWLWYRCPDSKQKLKDCNKTGGKSISEEEVDHLIKNIKAKLRSDKNFHRTNFDRYSEWLSKRAVVSQAGGVSDLEELEIKKKKLNTIVEQALSNDGDISQTMLDLIKKKQEEIAYEESRLQEIAEDGDSIEQLFAGSAKLNNPVHQRRLDLIREYAYKAVQNPEEKEIIFNEYYNFLLKFVENGELAPVYINEIKIKWTKGIDRNNRSRNIPKRFFVDIGNLNSTIEFKGTYAQASICLLVCTLRNITRLILSRKTRDSSRNKDRYPTAGGGFL